MTKKNSENLWKYTSPDSNDHPKVVAEARGRAKVGLGRRALEREPLRFFQDKIKIRLTLPKVISKA